MLRRQHIAFSKDDEEDLPARIERVWYINPYGHEIWPVANVKVLSALAACDTVIYSIGSLYTSIIPSLVLRGVGSAIANPRVRHKILVLNSKLDRETGPTTDPMTARDFVAAIARAGTESWAPDAVGRDGELRRYFSHLLYLEGEGTPAVNVEELEGLGIKCVRVASRRTGEGKSAMMRYDEKALGETLEAIVDS